MTEQSEPRMVPPAGVVQGRMAAIFQTLEEHAYFTEFPAAGEPYNWCGCGWRSDEHVRIADAANALHWHLTAALMNALANVSGSTEALAHTAAVLGEQRDAVLALVQQWLDETQEGQGVMRDHWRGVDYVDGDDYRAERCAEQLRAIYGFPE